MEVPRSLMPSFNMLKRYGFHLRKNEGKNKSNIRFDDYKRSLFLQVKFDEDRSGEWFTYYPDEVHDLLRKADQKRNSRVREMRGDFSPPVSPLRRPRRTRPTARDQEQDMDTAEEEDDVVFVNQAERWKPAPRNDK